MIIRELLKQNEEEIKSLKEKIKKLTEENLDLKSKLIDEISKHQEKHIVEIPVEKSKKSKGKKENNID